MAGSGQPTQPDGVWIVDPAVHHGEGEVQVTAIGRGHSAGTVIHTWAWSREGRVRGGRDVIVSTLAAWDPAMGKAKCHYANPSIAAMVGYETLKRTQVGSIHLRCQTATDAAELLHFLALLQSYRH